MIAGSVSTIVTSVLSVVSLLMFASKIPKTMMETRTQFRKLYQLALLDGGTISVQRLMLLKYFAEIEPFYLPVWDFSKWTEDQEQQIDKCCEILFLVSIIAEGISEANVNRATTEEIHTVIVRTYSATIDVVGMTML
ncbi:hypothetical protein CEXT_255531 [Caerostris extrusa]|uniref:Uncharacterized protein n=1 Tax=Caerostris extrusa TaxID=172846 RepID=A0AAV4QQ36_CAEEX|nr:hypothetical protein CEXT_255531 [Caerostris extrusa]